MWKAPYPVDSRRFQLCRTIVISRCEQSGPPKRHRAYGSRPPAFNTGVPTRGLSNLSPFPGCAACPQSGNDRGQIGICRGGDGYHCIRDTPAVPDAGEGRIKGGPPPAGCRQAARRSARPPAPVEGSTPNQWVRERPPPRPPAPVPSPRRRRRTSTGRQLVVARCGARYASGSCRPGPTGDGSTPGSIGSGGTLGRVPDFPGRYPPNGPWKIAPNV
jgi:hypothetical protein